MSETKAWSVDKLRVFVVDLLTGLNVPSSDAKDVANALIRAHLRGYDTHGLSCLVGYVEALKENRINPQPDIKFDQRTSWTWLVDGDNGLGQIAATRAMELALKEATKIGIGAGLVRGSNHFGAAGVYSLMAVEKECIGIVTSNASCVTAPHGAVEPMLGTNPLSVVVPAGKCPPFALDMATSSGSRKKVREALASRKPIPSGWALNKQGEPTTDPGEALEGVMLSFGGAKGSGITLLVDILSGVLTGAEFGGRVLSVFTNQERASNNGHFMLAMKIESFMPVESFKRRMDEELTRILNLKPADPQRPVFYPGYRSGLQEAKQLEVGIPLSVDLVGKLEEIGSLHGVRFPK
jgi:LDH2 family malate/lactate/ureidoglycolate dehydrogenase